MSPPSDRRPDVFGAHDIGNTSHLLRRTIRLVWEAAMSSRPSRSSRIVWRSESIESPPAPRQTHPAYEPFAFVIRISSFTRLVVTLMSLLTSFSFAANEPTRKELWVPSEHLNQVLKEHPSAVLLSPEQYDTLIRDAGKVKPVEDPKNKPPVDLVVESLHLKGKLQPEAETIRLTGTLTVFSTSEDWTQTELPWHLPLLAVHANGTLLASLSKLESIELLDTRAFTVPRTLHLHVKGRGRHMLTFDTHLHLQRDVARGWGELYVCGPALAGYLDLELPVDLQLLNSSAFQKLDASMVRLPFVKNTTFNIATINRSDQKRGRLDIPVAAVARWTTAGLMLPDDAPRFADGTTLNVSLSETEVITEQQLSLTKGGTSAATRAIQLRLTPQAQVTAVKGAEVIQWHQEADQLHLTLAANASTTVFTTTLRQPIEPEAKQIFLPQIFLPSPTTVTVNVRTSEGLDLLAVSGTEMRDSSIAGMKTFTAPLAALPTLQVRAAKPRLEVDSDTLVQLDKDSLTLTRTLNLRTDRPVHELRVTLPEGEEFIRIDSAAKDFEWKRVARVIEMRFPTGVTLAAPVLVNLHTRQKLLKAWGGPRIPELVKVQPLSIPEAVKIAGYSALSFDDSWRVALKDTSGLEDRDAKLAPVKGRMAWFGLRDWALGFEVERAEPVFSAEITAYALPRARTVEIEGEITLDISGAPLRTFQLKLPAAEAKLLRMTSPLIGQQQLDEATGQWTFTLRQESTGRQPLRFRLSLPAKVAANAEQTLQASLPVIELPAARRFAGTWVIEANTDTQVSFESQSLQPLDVLRAPPITGYQPRHRLIAAYTYGTGAHTLSLTAKRHAHSELAALVVRELRMISTLGEDGTALHEALLSIQHSGEQFVALALPEGAELLATASDGIPVKPIRSAEGTLAIPLPPGSANQPYTTLRVQYRLAGERWTSRGSLQLDPVRVLGTTPVLATEWRVLVPPGYAYPKVETTLEQTTEEDVPRVIPQLLMTVGLASGVVVLSESILEKQVDYLSGGPHPEESELQHKVQQKMRVVSTQQGATRLYEESASSESATEMKTRSIIYPQIKLENATIEEACEFLVVQARALDVNEADPSRRGYSIIVKAGEHSTGARINLDIKNVSGQEALRYICELAGMKFKIEPWTVLITPVTETTAEQFTRIYQVPKDFLTMGGASSSAVGATPAAPADPFASPDVAVSGLIRTMTASDILKAQGILFPEGANAEFDPRTSQLIVRNSGPNLDLIEAFTDSLLTYRENDDDGRRTAGLLVRKANKPQATKSNLISLDLDLPSSGQVLRFSGHQAPEALTLRYVSWERQLGFAMLAAVTGIAAFARWGRRRPWRSSLLVVAVLTFGAPLMMTGPALALANALIFGWLLALGGWIVWRGVEKTANALKLAKGKEVAV